MTNPERKLFLVRHEKQALLKYYQKDCRPLYGSDARYDPAGNILYPTWYPVKRETINPQKYVRLSRRRESEEKYLARPLTTLTSHEARIHRITKDNGSVEATIRSVEHALERYLPPQPDLKETGLERKQVATVKKRATAVLDLFASKDFSQITQEEFENAQRETIRKLIAVSLDPDRVILEEKEKMTRWVIKGSRGQDSLGRSNWLISTQSLEAAYRRAVLRELGIGAITTKFIRMREALKFEREFSRGIFQEAISRCRQMPLLGVFKSEKPPDSQIHITQGVLNTTIWQLKQPHVKPYRPLGREVGQILEVAAQLLATDQKEAVLDRNLFGDAKNLLEQTLEQQKDLYPQTASATASSSETSTRSNFDISYLR